MPDSHIYLALCSDRESFARHATLVASIVRRTSRPLWVKCFCHGFGAKSFEVAGLRVDFVELDEGVPGMSRGKPFDALQVLRDAPEWSRCLLMSGDQIAFQDIGPLHDLDLGGSISAAGTDQLSRTGNWRPAASDSENGVEFTICEPGCLIDLDEFRLQLAPSSKYSASRAQAAWNRFVDVRRDFRDDSGYAFSALVSPRLMALDPKWNQTDSLLGPDLVPEGVVTWRGSEKPWWEDDKVWGKDHWNAEKCWWEALRNGWWEKPFLLEVQPGGLRKARQMAARGWKVLVEELASPGAADSTGTTSAATRRIAPDLSVTNDAARNHATLKFLRMLRFGSGSAEEGAAGHLEGAAHWLAASNLRPEYVVVCGPVADSEIERLSAVGYDRMALMRRSEWPGGGPDPEALRYEYIESHQSVSLTKRASRLVIGEGVDGYLRRAAGLGDAFQANAIPSGLAPSVVRVVPRQEGDSTGWTPLLTPLYPQWRQFLVESKICEIETQSINLVISTDENGFEINATMLHSIVRRTLHPVHLRCYCRGFQPESFYIKNLLVEFIHVELDCGGVDPWSSHAGALGRLQVIQDHPFHWSRCWVMDHDQIATADLAYIYFGSFDGKLVQACSSGFLLRDACNLPDELRECGGYEFYKMGPILNLAAMRRQEALRTLLAWHARIGSNERVSLVAATRGKLKVLDDRWHGSVYQKDLDSSYREYFPKFERPESDWFENYGILNFNGGPKPWSNPSGENEPRKKERVWFKEYATWEKLKSGDWGAPDGCELLELAAIEYVAELG